jgi:hypothetical protein
MVIKALENEPKEFYKIKELLEEKGVKPSNSRVYQEPPISLNNFTLFRNYETVKKFLLFKFTYDNPKNTLEESYVLKEIRQDHLLHSKRILFVSIFSKGLLLFNVFQKVVLPFVPSLPL